jgi:hypothetical protein
VIGQSSTRLCLALVCIHTSLQRRSCHNNSKTARKHGPAANHPQHFVGSQLWPPEQCYHSLRVGRSAPGVQLGTNSQVLAKLGQAGLAIGRGVFDKRLPAETSKRHQL